jgi:hypothetical protein
MVRSVTNKKKIDININILIIINADCRTKKRSKRPILH